MSLVSQLVSLKLYGNNNKLQIIWFCPKLNIKLLSSIVKKVYW